MLFTRWETDDEINDVLITPEQIETFENGPMTREAVKTFGRAVEEGESFLPASQSVRREV